MKPALPQKHWCNAGFIEAPVRGSCGESAGEIGRLKAQGVGASEIAKRLGIGRASVYRTLKAST